MANEPFVQHPIPRSGQRVMLTNGRVVDVENGRILQGDPEVCIVIQDGRIEALPGTAGQPKAADIAADITLDLNGRWVLPGLTNTHCHIHLKLPSLLAGMGDLKLVKRHGRAQLKKEMADCLVRGITTIRDCVTDDLRHTWKLRDRIEGGGWPGPRILQAVLVGNLGATWTPRRGLKDRLLAWAGGLPYVDYEDPASGVIPFAPDASEQTVRDTVNRAIDERNADVIKLYEQRAAKVSFRPAPLMTESQLAAAADQARKRGVPCTAHHVSLECFRRIVGIGLTSIAHVPIDEPMTDDDLDRLVASRCPVEPTMSAAYDMCFNLPGTPEEHHDALARLADFRDRTFELLAKEYWLPQLQKSVVDGFDKMRRGKTKLMGFIDLSAAMRYHVGYISVGGENLRRIKDRSAPIGCGNDGGVPPCVVSMVGHELQMIDHVLNVNDAIRFTAADAVRTATLDSARAVGMADRIGSIVPGKIADLAVLDRNPLDDPACLGTPAAAVFKDGRLVVDRMGLAANARDPQEFSSD